MRHIVIQEDSRMHFLFVLYEMDLKNVAALNKQNSCIYVDGCQNKAQDNKKEEEQVKQKQKCTECTCNVMVER